MSVSSAPAAPRPVLTVLGPVPAASLGIVDAHNHVWIERIPGADPAGPVLNDEAGILAELGEYRAAGGGALLDCQPPGCGRNAVKLAALSRASGVPIVACTGFHRKKYYPPGFWLWSVPAEEVARTLVTELTQGMAEAQGEHIRAGFIKIALEATLAETPQAALEGAALTAAESGALMEVHTEKGAAAVEVLAFFTARGVQPERLVLCHMDKRADFGLHSELARAGVLLEYDTFFRPKYAPETHLWPLIERMSADGLADRVALGTDMAEAELYHCLKNGPGLASLPTAIRDGLAARGIPPSEIGQMLGGNIVRRLAGLA